MWCVWVILTVFVRSRGRAAWRFGAFVTAISHPPIVPVGYVDVDAVTGEVLADDHTAEEIASRGERLECIPHAMVVVRLDTRPVCRERLAGKDDT